MPESFPDTFVLGAGRVGRALIREMLGAGLPVVGAWNRGELGARWTREQTGLAASWGDLPDTREAGLVLLAVPDDAIAPVVSSLAERGGLDEHQVVLHTAGALPAAAARVGAALPRAVGCYHPLQTFAAPVEARGAYHVAVEGEPEAVALARAIAAATAHPVLRVTAEHKALYHAAASVSSNFTLTLQALALELARKAGLDPLEAESALLTLLKGTVGALERHGLRRGLTGPIARGDAATVAAHVQALEAHAPESLPLYRALGRRTLALTGRASDADAALRELLAER